MKACDIHIDLEEVWRDITGYEGKYQISNRGNVKSLNYHNTNKESLLKPATDNKGYLRCALSKGNVLSTFKVHRLVANAFIPNPLGLPHVNHIDGNKKNNHFSNLEWCDNSMNQIHAYQNGLNPRHVGHKVGITIIDREGNPISFDSKKDASLFLGFKTIMPLNRALKNGEMRKGYKIVERI